MSGNRRNNKKKKEQIPTKVIHIQSEEHLGEELLNANNKLVVIDFYATWCGPCKTIAPKVEEWSVEFQDSVVFLKVDSDEVEELTKSFDISLLPTFVFWKNGNALHSVTESREEKLLSLIQKYQTWDT